APHALAAPPHALAAPPLARRDRRDPRADPRYALGRAQRVEADRGSGDLARRGRGAGRSVPTAVGWG
ncbi:MAG: hypothetical protein ACRDZT_07595, partial [Acidimicrobiales bacterium]